jgi:hypothetical protein
MTTGTLTSPEGRLPTPPGGSAPSPAPLSPAVQRRARRTLLLLIAVCVLPVVASYAMFYLWQPQGRVNHGVLIEPVALPHTELAGLSGHPALSRSSLEGQWTLLVLAPAACDAVCERALYASRQARLAQAKEMHRVGRVWLVSDEPAVATVTAGSPSEVVGTSRTHFSPSQLSPSQPSGMDAVHLARADAAWQAVLQQAAGQGGASTPAVAPAQDMAGTVGTVHGAVFLVDPLGQVMMRFDDRGDAAVSARALTKDLQRLLKYSALGRGE